jgi:plasmid stabilization system protein ParE
MSGFVLHPSALTDLDEIWEFIAADNLTAADRVLDEIVSVIASLVSFPQMGHSRPELTSRALRFHPVRSFVLVYAPDESPLQIIAVLHGRRNPRLLAALLRERE